MAISANISLIKSSLELQEIGSVLCLTGILEYWNDGMMDFKKE
jgi:hypothetical protein